jgi:hypothetical protein
LSEQVSLIKVFLLLQLGRLRQGNISSFARYQDINNETPADSK